MALGVSSAARDAYSQVEGVFHNMATARPDARWQSLDWTLVLSDAVDKYQLNCRPQSLSPSSLSPTDLA